MGYLVGIGVREHSRSGTAYAQRASQQGRFEDLQVIQEGWCSGFQALMCIESSHLLTGDGNVAGSGVTLSCPQLS